VNGGSRGGAKGKDVEVEGARGREAERDRERKREREMRLETGALKRCRGLTVQDQPMFRKQ